ncbi:MAG: hypothetical protein R3F20_04550 [Planctomycetota bacterium]
MTRPASLSRAHALVRRVRARLAGARALRLTVSLGAIGLGAAAIPLAISRLVPVAPGAAETAALAGVGAALLLAAILAWCDRPTVAEAARRVDAAGDGRSLVLTAIAMSESETATPLGALFLRDLERRLRHRPSASRVRPHLRPARSRAAPRRRSAARRDPRRPPRADRRRSGPAPTGRRAARGHSRRGDARRT